MQKREMTLIYYHVPEDKDHPQEPNVFSIPMPQNKLQLAHIHQYFPLKGTYTFRFKYPHDEFVVWLDLSEPEAPLPAFKDQIHIKANRLSWHDKKTSIPVPPVSNPTPAPTIKKPSIDLFDHHDQGPSVPSTKEQKKNGFADINLLDSHSHVSSQPTLSGPTVSPLKVDFFATDLPQSNSSHKNGSPVPHSGDLI